MSKVFVTRLRAFVRRLRSDRSGLALLEFAFILPVLVLMALAGAELTNYIAVKMRVSQLALRIADDASRIGTGSQLAAKTITEADINDLFEGANLQAGELDLKGRGRVILSSLEPIASPNATNRYKISWQRCFGAQTTATSSYGTAGQTNLTGMGPAGRQVTAQDNSATMFVEVYYIYKPLLNPSGASAYREIASMAVRDNRDLSDDARNPDGSVNPAPLHPAGIYRIAGVPSSTC